MRKEIGVNPFGRKVSRGRTMLFITALLTTSCASELKQQSGSDNSNVDIQPTPTLAPQVNPNCEEVDKGDALSVMAENKAKELGVNVGELQADIYNSEGILVDKRPWNGVGFLYPEQTVCFVPKSE